MIIGVYICGIIPADGATHPKLPPETMGLTSYVTGHDQEPGKGNPLPGSSSRHVGNVPLLHYHSLRASRNELSFLVPVPYGQCLSHIPALWRRSMVRVCALHAKIGLRYPREQRNSGGSRSDPHHGGGASATWLGCLYVCVSLPWNPNWGSAFSLMPIHWSMQQSPETSTNAHKRCLTWS